jgi:type IV pilus assembly protein PilE
MKNTGFSLIELLFALVIVSILASLVYPSYQAHITQTRRNDAKIALLDLASRMEARYLDEQTYAKTTLATGNPSDILSSNITANGWYQLAITLQDDTFYQLEAKPLHAQATLDKQCQTFTLNSLGVKGVTSGSIGCW